MNEDAKPLSTLVAQGWEIIGYTGSMDNAGNAIQNILLRRQKQHRVLSIRPKMLGKGLVAKEMDI